MKTYCKNWRRYKGIRPPKCGCLACDYIYYVAESRRIADRMSDALRDAVRAAMAEIK
jgi:hypothetical protein